MPLERSELNIRLDSKERRSKLLSALINRPFMYGNRFFASLEGWYQGIKFPHSDERRFRAFASTGLYAKRFSKQAERQWIWWVGKYPYAGKEHKEFIREAFRASFEPGSDRTEALLSTAGMVLTHETGEPDAPDSPLTKAEFAALLMEIREEMLCR